MEIKRVLLIGGSGFVGGWIADALNRKKMPVRIPSRRPERVKALGVLPQVELLSADVHDPETLLRLMQGVDAVINLVGILHDSDNAVPYGRRFAAAHALLPARIVAAMKESGIRRLVHMSALKAASDAPSAYLRSKAAGEVAVLAAAGELDVTVFRPSVIFGPGDAFLNVFAGLLKAFPVMPLGGCTARFQPVYAGDVAGAFVGCLDNTDTFGQVYELGGPKIYTLRQLVEYTGELTGHRRPVIPLPGPLAYLQARLLSLLPNPPMSPDNLRSMQVDNVTGELPAYPGWCPQSLEAVAPGYLSSLNPKQRLDGFRHRSGRP
jgi:uncharacterized protein YbjT (DUF2867 family)